MDKVLRFWCVFGFLLIALPASTSEHFKEWKSPWDGNTYYQCMAKGGVSIITEDTSKCIPKKEADAILAEQIRRQNEKLEKARAEALATPKVALPEKSKTPCESIDYSALAPLIHRTTNSGRYIYVKRGWYQVPLDTKQSLALYLATCRSTAGWVEIYDAYSGKKLAKWGALGYSNYEQ